MSTGVLKIKVYITYGYLIIIAKAVSAGLVGNAVTEVPAIVTGNP